MTTQYFVTGTDTGVGKTTVAAGILTAARTRGLRVAALKPVETGCAPEPQDAIRLRAAAGLESLPLDAICPIRYTLPVAPAVAARREARPFTIDTVMRARAALLADDPDLLLIEGAGGLLVPYTDAMLGVHLVRALGTPLLIVARASLGTINHTLLTIAEARRHEIPIAGVILNRVIEARAPDEDDNAAEIARHGRVRVLGTVPFGGDGLPFSRLVDQIT
jgi:dethiobiotin synthetase